MKLVCSGPLAYVRLPSQPKALVRGLLRCGGRLNPIVSHALLTQGRSTTHLSKRRFCSSSSSWITRVVQKVMRRREVPEQKSSPPVVQIPQPQPKPPAKPSVDVDAINRDFRANSFKHLERLQKSGLMTSFPEFGPTVRYLQEQLSQRIEYDSFSKIYLNLVKEELRSLENEYTDSLPYPYICTLNAIKRVQDFLFFSGKLGKSGELDCNSRGSYIGDPVSQMRPPEKEAYSGDNFFMPIPFEKGRGGIAWKESGQARFGPIVSESERKRLSKLITVKELRKNPSKSFQILRDRLRAYGPTAPFPEMTPVVRFLIRILDILAEDIELSGDSISINTSGVKIKLYRGENSKASCENRVKIRTERTERIDYRTSKRIPYVEGCSFADVEYAFVREGLLSLDNAMAFHPYPYLLTIVAIRRAMQFIDAHIRTTTTAKVDVSSLDRPGQCLREIYNPNVIHYPSIGEFGTENFQMDPSIPIVFLEVSPGPVLDTHGIIKYPFEYFNRAVKPYQLETSEGGNKEFHHIISSQ